ncbi:MAG: hypothetical protein D3904_11085 [Candidatus Electrothrix sp. EH2]|nr:hypothetical protein [Candidatus Electrothrix sp. EH2]
MFFLKSSLPLFLLFSCLCLLSPVRAVSSTIPQLQELSDAVELVSKSDATLQAFLQYPNIKWFRKNISTARAVFIAPQILRGEFLIGNSGGSGILLARDSATGKWSYPGFYAINSITTGLQIGADASEIILLVITEQGMHAMLQPELRMGAKIVAAAGPVGNGTPPYRADIIAYARSMTGIINGISLAGAVITPRNALNNAYYGRTVTLQDILLRRTAKNYQAEFLRRRLGTTETAPLLIH